MTTQTHIKSALERSVQAVSLKPALGQRVYTNIATVEHGTICRTVEKDQEITVDVGKGMGGQDAGPTPSTLLRTALSSCIAIGIKLWASREDVLIDKITVAVDTDVDARGILAVSDDVTPGFGAISIAISVESDAEADAIERVIEKSFRYSTLLDVFCKPQAVETAITINAPIAA
nr:OsmC family protein [Hyphomonas sp. Mor2]